MSQEVLKVIAQLFSLLSDNYKSLTRKQQEVITFIFESRLGKQQAEEYLNIFEEYAVNTTENSDTSHQERILLTCAKVNRTLTEKQKLILFCEILEFINAAKRISTADKETLGDIRNAFGLKEEDYNMLSTFVLSPIPNEPVKDIVLLGRVPPPHYNGGFMKAEQLHDYISILRLERNGLFFLKYHGTEDISLNGAPIISGKIYLFSYGSIIRLSKGSLVYYGDILSYFSKNDPTSPVCFNCKNVSFTFPDGTLALRDINISENKGTLFGIMGASGAGKTTLINIMSGILQPNSGSVEINGYDIHESPEEIKGVIGHVSQEDLLIEELTVFENLYYNARLSFGQKTVSEIRHMVTQMLRSLNLNQIKHLKVGNQLNKFISGGQRKRLNIALELIREPAVLFVDEPTSGLSSRDSQNVIDLLKELSLKGKLIFVIIHQPSSDIFKLFDKIYIMDTGGYPAYYGSPLNAVSYFKKATKHTTPDEGQCEACGNVNPEQIFDIIEAQVVNEFGRLTERRNVTPSTWWKLFQKNFIITQHKPTGSIPHVSLHIPHKVKQFYLFASRDIKSKLSNRQYLLINLIQAPLLAFLLAWVIRYTPAGEDSYSYSANDNIPAFFLMSVIVALFTGLMNSAEEIIKDRKILKREQFLNLSRHSYLSAKIFILFTISGFQAAMYVAVGNSVLGISGFFSDFWLIFFSTACFANIIGLNLSSAMNSVVNVYIVIPLLLIPQMILSGALFPFDKLNCSFAAKEVTPIIADLMVSRWAYEALAVRQYTSNGYQKYFYDTHQKIRKAHTYKAFLLPELEAMHAKDNDNHARKFVAFIASDMDIELDNKLSTKGQIQHINQALIHLSNQYADQKEYIVNQLEKRGISVSELKNKYYNENLGRVVRNAGSRERISLKNNSLSINTEQVFFRPIPQHQLDYRAHFFAPEKHIGGRYVTTFIFNCIVIWGFSMFFYITLYRETFNISIRKTS